MLFGFMSAMEARDKANKLISEDESKQAQEIRELINRDLKKGQTTYYGCLMKNVESNLRLLGYKIEHRTSTNQRDGKSVIISW